ncbi:MAG: type II secretion system secretin GspD [Deltaproteobacteria bacterium]|nr:type II secretion system secretin GspD [Deltaproteobacteria bacterium]
MNRSKKIFFSCICVAVWLIGTSAAALGASPPGSPEVRSNPGAGKGEAVERYVTIDFEDVDINLFIKYISELTGKNFIIDKAVRGNVTIVSPTKISIDEAYKVFESVLEVQGFTSVPAGTITKIVPAADARSKSVETGFKEETGEITDKVVTQLIPLQYADPDELKKLFTPLVSKNSVVIAYPATNLLIVTDVLSNINRLLQIIKEIDVEENVSEITVIPIENAIASEVATTLDTIFQGTSAKRTTTARATTARRRTPAQAAAPAETGPALGEVKIIADERTNSLIVIASLYDTEKVKSLVAILDKEIPRGTGNINVYYLQHANAEELSKVLTALPEQTDKAAEKGKAPTISKEVQIVADQATNSLVITANKADYAVLEEVIRKLDIPRRMVYLEALIMEVNTEKDFSVGVEWIGAAKYSIIGDDEGVLFGRFRPGESSNIPSLTELSVPNPQGLAMGVFSEPIMINDVPFPSLGAILTAFKSDEDVHIISTPQILTTDNEEAEIKVGENVPYITSRQNTGGTTDSYNYTNYEYKDVGVTLKITPQINQENVVRLEVYVEVIKISGGLEESTPTTFKRTAQTTVIVQDSDTLVLGGIIGDDITDNANKIPILGDIPGLGWLFKAESQSVRRVNLYIFLTPRIIRNPTEAKAVTDEKREDAIHQHETGWETEKFKYKEDTKNILRLRHTPPSMREGLQIQEETESIEE